MRLVLDTNVLVSAFFWDGNERRVLRGCTRGPDQLVTSPYILAELEDVLMGKFDVPKERTHDFTRRLIERGLVVVPEHELSVIEEDPTDDRVLECAVEGRADAILTGDRHLLDLGTYGGIEILNAARLLKRRS